MEIYCGFEFISGFMIGFEFAEDETINYIIIDLGIVRININWDK